MGKKLTEQITKSEKMLGQLFPVLVDGETGEVLDGRERLTVNPNWHRKEIEITGTEEEKALKRLMIKHHANWHRKDTSTKYRTDALTEIAEKTGWSGLKPFAEFLGVSERTISTYLPQKYKNKAKSNARKDKKVSVERLSTEEILKEIEWDYSLWSCLEKRLDGFGDEKFHGNCSPVVIIALLKRYSSLDDGLIFDPMAGSGTFIDIARDVGYQDDQILARDITPLRDDIEFGDAENTGLSDESVDFIFAHFPYWQLIEYSDHKEDLSRLAWNEYLGKTRRIMKEMHRILKHGKFFAVMIGNLRRNGIIDLESLFSQIGSENFILWDKIIKKIRTWNPESRGQRMGLALSRARQHNYTVPNHDTILVFRRLNK